MYVTCCNKPPRHFDATAAFNPVSENNKFAPLEISSKNHFIFLGFLSTPRKTTTTDSIHFQQIR